MADNLPGDYPNSGIVVYDISTPAAPVLIHYQDMDMYQSSHITSFNGFLIVSHYAGLSVTAGGVSIIDVSNLTNLIHL